MCMLANQLGFSTTNKETNQCWPIGSVKHSKTNMTHRSSRDSANSATLIISLKASLMLTWLFALAWTFVFLPFSSLPVSQPHLFLDSVIMLWSSACSHVPDLPSLLFPLPLYPHLLPRPSKCLLQILKVLSSLIQPMPVLYTSIQFPWFSMLRYVFANFC